MKLGRWSTTAASNNTTPPDGWPEGQAPSTVNDCAREMMASIRTVFQDAQFVDQDFTPTFATTTSFTVPGNQTSAIHAGRRLKLFDATAAAATTIYATVVTASFTAVTTIHISADDAAAGLTSSLSSFAISILSNTNNALPRSPAGTFDRISASNIEANNLQVSLTATFAGTVDMGRALSVSGTAVFQSLVRLNSTLTVSGATSLLSTLTASGAVSMLTTLSVSGATVLKGALSVGGNTTIQNNLSVGLTLNVTGAVSLGSTVLITGATTISDTLTVSGATVLKGALSVGGAGFLGTTLTVSGAVVGKSSFVLNPPDGAATFELGNQQSAAAATIDFHSGTTLVDFDSRILATSGTGANGGGLLQLNATTVAFTGDATVSGALVVAGATTLGGTLSVSGAAVIKGALSVSGTSVLTGAVRAEGTLTVSGAAVLGALGFDGAYSQNLSGFSTTIGTIDLSAGANGNIILRDGGTEVMRLRFLRSTNNFEFLVSALAQSVFSFGSGGSVIVSDLRVGGALTASAAVTMQSTLTVSGTVTMLGGLSVSGSVNSQQVARAWVRFNVTTTAATTPVIISSSNIAAVSRSATGVYRVTFANAFANATYAWNTGFSTINSFLNSVSAIAGSMKFTFHNGTSASDVGVNGVSLTWWNT